MSFKHLFLAAVGLLLLYGLFTVGAPFLLACVIAMGLEPLTKAWMRWFKWGRIPAAVLSCTLFTLFLLSGMYYIVIQIIKQLVELVKNSPTYIEGVRVWLEQTMSEAQVNMPEHWEGMFEQLFVTVSGHLQDAAATVSAKAVSLAGVLPNMFIFFIVFMVALFLISFSLDRTRPAILHFFDGKSHHQVNQVITTLKSSVFGFVRAQIILCLFTYVITLCGLLILGTSYPLAIALLVMIVDLLPILGVGSALMPWAVYCIATGDLFTGIGLVVMFIVITALRRIIEPKVVGDSVGIGALPALVSLYVGFKLVGVMGFFIGPLVVIIYNAIRKAGLMEIKIKF
ncbi:sporulation integral membrane protein YtvI [Paenibacillus arenosi]|uniref:Sporulation integral membrane protein YtvI n=1 Tax=Paenibacillus arenosi TaxID=2774142 RepID=A0ABR9B1D0_9BACL|nr:sporulation integral membrane protein YtvI [Paenibacillus arenosi]MBD8500175.1 sporulation integral membrane protein YtvI [Paenibacillus arenosi]